MRCEGVLTLEAFNPWRPQRDAQERRASEFLLRGFLLRSYWILSVIPRGALVQVASASREPIDFVDGCILQGFISRCRSD